jgi:Ca-activated chloride channel homolog
MTHAPASLTLMSDDEIRQLCPPRDDHGLGGLGGLGGLSSPRGALPLVAMSIDARITGLVAATELEQTFVNTLGAPIEATYVFPLPDRAAVTRFRMEVAGRIIDGVVEERGAAREQYDAAIAAGHRAAITEEERAGVFTLRVGNLMPGEAATVKLTLTGPLPVADGEVTFQFPLVVAPRYIPGAALGGAQAGTGWAADTDAVPDASRITPPVLLPGQPTPVRLAIRAVIDAAGVPVRGVASSLHAVTEAARGGAIVIAIQPGERLDRDFILRWHVGDAAVRSCLFCADDADGQGGTFVATLVPPTEGLAPRPRDVAFVLDRSGSMGGWKMIAARRAVARMVDSLGPRDRFCVLAFDDRLEYVPALGDGLVAGTDRNRFRAVEFLATVGERGGTEMAHPLATAAAMLAGGYDDRDRVLVLATDGQVGDEDRVLRGLAPMLRNVRVFTLGIDRAVNAAFLRRLAAAGGGACELVESEDRLDAVMDKVHRRIATPVVTEVTLTGDTLAIDAATVTPRRLPDLFAGAPITIAGRYRGKAPPDPRVAIAGRWMTAGALGVERQTITGKHAPDAAAVTAVWARGRIRDLEDLYVTGGQSAEVEREIVAVSTRYSVLSRFTAFLAVDRTAVVNPGGELRAITQPVEQPDGWGAEGADGGGRVGQGGQHVNKPRARFEAELERARQRVAAPSASAVPPPASPITLPPRIKIAERGPGGAPPAAPSGAVRGRFAQPSDRRDQSVRAKLPLTRGAARPGPSAPPPPVMAHPAPAAAPASSAASIDDTAYRARLVQLAEAIERAFTGPPAQLASALALALVRLQEWIEDARSVGLRDLEATAMQIADQLALAIRDALQRVGAGTEAARRLRELAGGVTAPGPAPAPGPGPAPAGGGRVAFWK